ncbi:outer membrane protein assembly factor BamE [Rhizomicrobium electricum]|jgi:outer membrane protein assembly factor BamE (lipoprotein component of BamABCDE complex)|uniref:Outer membrane protein assembly factor BamE n=1 Tax=Rhizomicrobium electricum TaxID=480070 RepID=A0ABN1EQD5_9PROT|nr:outer membrane protein assembly factor BamE [Rhizomicrobium electricum]NIJ48781.1 outer membrane protein assembly factor BamE (lipoprotein component of BamABCDE complex) [Rhizomicrobium electricum]
MKKVVLFVAASIALAGCSPVISNRGYLENQDAEAGIAAGVDTKTTIEQKLGDPSVQAAFGTDAWYYISQQERQVAFFDPTITSRHILAIYFDKEGKVSDMKHFGLEDGNVVAFESRTTPTRGREMTFLQQLFNATPGMPGAQDQQERNPGGGGGPGR